MFIGGDYRCVSHSNASFFEIKNWAGQICLGIWIYNDLHSPASLKDLDPNVLQTQMA